MSNEAERVVRRAYGSGRWFPGSRAKLEPMVKGYIDKAVVPAVKGRIVGAIAPHAGYIYSGSTAGCAFRAIRDNATDGNSPDAVVVLGFSHRGGFPGVAVMDGDAISTPMGDAELDKALAGELVAGSRRISFNYAPHAGEHSAENEIPFVQAALPDTKIVVAIIGDHNSETIGDLVKGLAKAAGSRKLLVVASTDLLHDADYGKVTSTDKKTLAMIESMDHAALVEKWNYAEQLCCGIAPVLAVMKFAEGQGSRKGNVVHYRNSGDDFPESRGNWVVGYGAVVFAAE